MGNPPPSMLSREAWLELRALDAQAGVDYLLCSGPGNEAAGSNWIRGLITALEEKVFAEQLIEESQLPLCDLCGERTRDTSIPCVVRSGEPPFDFNLPPGLFVCDQCIALRLVNKMISMHNHWAARLYRKVTRKASWPHQPAQAVDTSST